MDPLRIVLILLTLLAVPAAHARGLVYAGLDSAFLVKGEVTRLTLTVEGETRPSSLPTFVPNPDLTIRPIEEGLRILPNRKRVFSYSYSVQSFTEGTHQIPVFKIMVGGSNLESQPLRVRIAPISELTFATKLAGTKDLRYYSAVFVPDQDPFQGEAFRSEVKVYLPESAGSTTPGVAELAHPGLVAWRFEPVPTTSRAILPTGKYLGHTFRSTATPIRSGEVTLGPGTARVVIRIRRLERGFTLWEDIPLDLDVPSRPIMSLPLPPGAPGAFAGAVGRFAIRSTADTDALEEGDPIAVRLTVTGRGNLDTLPAPTLDAPADEWKTYDPSRLDRQDERRDITGEVRFSQIIRPLLPQQEIPAFQLAFFDPEARAYRTARTAPILFKTLPGNSRSPSVAVIPTLSTPLEDMQGILGLVDPFRGESGRSSGFRWLRYWQILPAAIGLGLMVRLLQRHVFPRFQRSERERQVLKALDTVAQAGPGAEEFLRASGHFIERWIPPAERSGDLDELLARRDTDCFRPDIKELTIEDGKRDRILQQLKTLALHAGRSLTIAVLLLAGQSWGTETPLGPEQLHRLTEQAWKDGNYRVAIDHLKQVDPDRAESADTLYNIGNCHYQLGEPGLAALHYHRALLRDPWHPEARQNLRFIETKLGSITILRKPYEQFLAHLGRRSYGNALRAGTWAVGLSILALFALASRSGRTAAWAGLISGGVLTATATICWIYYPDDAEFAPLAQQGIVTSAERIEARTEASAAGSTVIEAPPGSRCRILAPRGPWTYVEFANLTRGWLPSHQVSPLVAPTDTAETRL